MINSLPSGRRGQMLALGLAVLTLATIWLGVVSPVLAFYGARSARIDDLRLRVARERALIAILPRLAAQARAAAQRPTRAVLSGHSDAIAGATLQESVQSMASGVNAQLTSIETLPAEQEGQYRRIGVHVELSARLGVVIGLLRAIEDAQPRMLIDDLRLTSTPAGPQNPQLPLDSAFTVYAFRAGTGKEDPP